MKCPRCDTENGTRSVCSECGMFLYDGQPRNRVKLSREEKRRENVNRVKGFSKVFLTLAFRLAVMILASALILAAILHFAG